MKSTSVSTSATTPRDTAPQPAAGLTEAQYLDAQAQQAKATMRATLGEIQADLVRGLSPLGWTKSHPWLAMITSTVGGFATAAVLIPSKEQQALEKLRRLHEAMHPAPNPPADEKHSKSTEVKEGALGALLLRQLIGLIQPLISSLLRAAVAPPAKPPASAPPSVPPAPNPSRSAPVRPL